MGSIDYIVGNSLGELSSLYLNGYLPMEDVFELACERGRIIEEFFNNTPCKLIRLWFGFEIRC